VLCAHPLGVQLVQDLAPDAVVPDLGDQPGRQSKTGRRGEGVGAVAAPLGLREIQDAATKLQWGCAECNMCVLGGGWVGWSLGSISVLAD